MKWHFLVLGSAAFALVSCQTGEVTTSSEFNPLLAPGSNRATVSKRAGYAQGSFVRTIMDNVAFFKKPPKGDMDADKQLPVNTEIKVISDDGNYVKGELNSGEIGYILSVQVSDQKMGIAPAIPGNEFQVYPPPVGGVPPIIDPNAPTISPTIDPTPPPVPDVPPVPELENPPTPDVPAAPPTQPAPLPPGNESE